MSRFTRACLGALAACAVLVVPATAAQARPVEVMTQNLYLGSDLTPAVAAGNLPAFFAAANQIWANVKATNFPARAERIAREVDAKKPDILALEEVSNWHIKNTSAQEPSFDFLQILQDELAKRNLNYTVASVSDNATIGPVPLPGPGAPFPATAFLVNFHDRDVILVRDRKGVNFSNPQDATYATQLSLPAPAPLPPFEFTRGWASIDAVVDKQAFKFVATHLEVQSGAPIQVAQATELLAGPLAGPGPTIVAGDFNSAADGTQTATYGLMTGPGAFADVWNSASHPGGPNNLGLSCCQAGDLLNLPSQLDQRIDFVFTKIAGKQGKPEADLVGEKPGDRTASGLWPSDHAGLWARVHLSH